MRPVTKQVTTAESDFGIQILRYKQRHCILKSSMQNPKIEAGLVYV